MESIAGAILVDTSFNLDAVWVVMKPLLSPIITPETLMQHPVVELQELCSRNGYNHALKIINYGQEVIAKYEVISFGLNHQIFLIFESFVYLELGNA